MADAPATQILIGRAVFIATIALLIFLQMLPISAEPPQWAGPDIVLVFTLVWVARRPELAPVLVIACVYLLTDMLFQRPPGLWSAIVVIMTEMLRARRAAIRNMPLWMEWGMVALAVIIATVTYRVALLTVMLPVAPAALGLSQIVATVLAYPVVATLAHFAFRVTRPALGEVDSRGHRL